MSNEVILILFCVVKYPEHFAIVVKEPNFYLLEKKTFTVLL